MGNDIRHWRHGWEAGVGAIVIEAQDLYRRTGVGFRTARVSLSRIVVITTVACLLLNLLTACSAPRRAPVVSRESSAPVQTPNRIPSIYRVKRGDTLYAIAWRYGLNFSAVARWNGLSSPYTIYPGQRLRLTPQRSKSVTTRPIATSGGKTAKSQGSGANTDAVVSKKPVSDPSKGRNGNAKEKPEVPSSSLKLHWTWPTNGTVVERFVRGDPVRKGVKIQGRVGASVKAAESGKVVYAGSGLIGYGRLVIIKHNKNYLSAYGHNRKIHVKEGDVVKKGLPIAEMGSDGNGKPVLHFEIRRNGAPVDPLKLLPKMP